MDSKTIKDKIIAVLEDKKAIDIRIIDISEVSSVADYFVICSGTSTTHIRTLADEIDEKLSEQGINAFHKDGFNSARWILLDYGDVVVHIFHEEDREFYSLERLWSEGTMTYV